MSIFRRKKKNEETAEPQVVLYSPQMLVKRLLWDIVPCPSVSEMLPLMGLIPDSADVAEMEHVASHQRLQNLEPMSGLLEILVPLVSGITASAMLVNSGNQVDEETALGLQHHHSRVVRSAVYAVLANLLDMGLISYTDGVQIGEQLLG